MITFTCEHKDLYGDHEEVSSKIIHSISADSTLDEVVEAFEYFLKGCGYSLPEGTHIGYEYEDNNIDLGLDGDDNLTFDFMVDNGAASGVYTVTDTNGSFDWQNSYGDVHITLGESK